MARVLLTNVMVLLALLAQCQAVMYFGKPARGWNSYDGFTCTVNEQEVRDNAKVMSEQLLKFNYSYVTIDFEWFRPGMGEFSCCGRNPWQDLVVDKYGRALPSPDRYPSAKGSEETGLPGFKPLADSVHELGLKFGIHIMRGIPRIAVEKNMPIYGSKYTAQDAANNKTDCGWCDDMSGVQDNDAGQAYYNSLVSLYTEWGVDFIKMDCAYGLDYESEQVQLASAIKAEQSREFLLSMSPTDRDPNYAVKHKEDSSMYRINGDVWDNWGGIKSAFETAPSFAGLLDGKSSPDLDMLPLGRLSVRSGHGPNRTTALTHDEQYTMMNLWGMFRNPFIMGGDLRSLPQDSFTMSLLTNPDLLAIQQDSEDNKPIQATAYALPRSGQPAYTEFINVRKCLANDKYQQWGHVSATGDGTLPNHATFGCLTLVNCSQKANASVGSETCRVGKGCEDGRNQIWEVTRDGYIDTPMNQACLTTTAATTLPCNVTAVAKTASLEKQQIWRRNQTDNTLHHIASGGCLTLTPSGLVAGEAERLPDSSVAAWSAIATSQAHPVHYVALFNLDDTQRAQVSVPLSQLAITAKSCDLVNIWTGQTINAQSDASAQLDPHASALYKIDSSKCHS